MTPARIVGFRVPDPPPPPTQTAPVAVLTLEFGPLLISGLRLYVEADGQVTLKAPTMRARSDRFVFRAGPERDAVLAQARSMCAGLIEARLAAMPLATAPNLESDE